MPRAISGKTHNQKRKKILKDTKGFYGARSILYRTAKDARRRALTHSYNHRRAKKGDFRALWILRINAGARICGISYSKLINGLQKCEITINRKMLADIAVKDFNAFQKIVDTVKEKTA
ncbi:MAG: 50S ribosomal protein L20 [Spirochaetes bacterium]|nr:50S ribosomal protein L20 [Spirochaetota bacterium]